MRPPMSTALSQLVHAALAEDVGDGDVTTEATVDPATRGRATMARARQSSWRWPCERFKPPSEMGEVRSLKTLEL